VHLGETAFVQEIDDELQLVHDLVVGNLRLITRLDQRLESSDDKFGGPTAQNCLLAEQVGLGFFRERRLNDAGASSTNASRVGERLLEGIAGRVLVDSDQARYTVSFLVLSAYKASGTFRSDQRNVEVVARLDLIVMDCKPMGEQQKRAVVDIVDDRVVQRFFVPCRALRT
jgi:hypothetical protein